MIIKLHSSAAYARQKEAKIPKALTRNDRIKGDRFVMFVMFLITIVGAIVFA